MKVRESQPDQPCCLQGFQQESGKQKGEEMERGVLTGEEKREFYSWTTPQVFSQVPCIPLLLLSLTMEFCRSGCTALCVGSVWLSFLSLKCSRAQAQGGTEMSWPPPAALLDLSPQLPMEREWMWPLLSQENTSPLTHFEVGCFQGGAGEEPGEHHVDGDGEAPADVAVGDLDVLDLCGIPGIALSTAWGGKWHRSEKAAAKIHHGEMLES